MSVIDIKDATIKLRDGTTPAPNDISIKIGEGNLTYNETRNREYILDRGQIDSVRDGDEAPLELSFDIMWEEISSSFGSPATVEDALKKRGNAASWITSGADVCEPYTVDVELELDAACGDAKDREYLTFPEYRYESLNHDLRAGTVATSGNCNVLQARIEHAHAEAIAALFVAANSEFLDIADSAALSATTDLTFGVWFKPLTIGTRQFIASKHDDGVNGAWALSMETDGTLRVNIATLLTTALDTDYYNTALTLAVDTWYFILFQYDGGQAGNSTRLRIWIDDVEDTTGAYTGTIPVTMPAEAAAIQLGAHDATPADFADGVMSTAGMWTRTLLAAEKTSMYFGGLGRLYSDLTTAEKVSLVAWWALSETSGQRVDSHSNNHLGDNASVLSADGVRVLKSAIGSLP